VLQLCQRSLDRVKVAGEEEAVCYIRPLLQALADLQARGIVPRWARPARAQHL
jgi:hypothetical protein